LNTEIDRPGISEYMRVLVSMKDCFSEVITKGDDSVSRERDERKQYQAEPSRIGTNERFPTQDEVRSLLLADSSTFSDMFDTLDEPLGSETNDND
jgi:hypothetical protein